MFQRYTNEELWEIADRRYPSPSPRGLLAVLGMASAIGLVILALVLLGPSGNAVESTAGGDPLTNFLMRVDAAAGTRCYDCPEGTVGSPWDIPSACREVPCQ